MTIYKQGDIVLVPFPFPDLSTTKKRPALVISADWYNQKYHDVVLAGITSHIPVTLQDLDYSISEFDFKTGQLYKKSIVKLGKLFTIESNLIIKKIADLQENILTEILNQLTKLFQENK